MTIAHITITLKNGVLDPQGKAICNALDHMGFTGVDDARQGKFIELHLAEKNEEKAKAQAEEMCEKLLANGVIENFEVKIASADKAKKEKAA